MSLVGNGVRGGGLGPIGRRSLGFAVAALLALAMSASCSNTTQGPANGSSCQANSDCASNCCLAGGYPPDPTAPAKICTEPSGCYGEDATSNGGEAGGDSGEPAEAAPSGDTGAPPVDAGASDTGSSTGGDSAAAGDTGGAGDTGAPHDAATGG